MSVVGRVFAGVVVAGLVLVGGPAAAQGEDPCAPGPDGAVPEMCQSGAPASDTGTVGMEPEPGTDPCPGQPFEPGDGVVVDGEPGTEEPGTDTTQPDPEPAPEQVDPAQEGQPEDGVICLFSAPTADGSGGDVESAPGSGPFRGTALPRTGPYDQLLALTAIGTGLLVLGAGAAAAGRRRRT